MSVIAQVIRSRSQGCGTVNLVAVILIDFISFVRNLETYKVYGNLSLAGHSLFGPESQQSGGVGREGESSVSNGQLNMAH